MVPRLLIFVLLFCSQIALAGSLPPSQTLRRDFWDTDGSVHSVLATNGKVYVGGSFSYVAPRGSKLLSLDLFTGTPDRTFPAIYGRAIHSIIEDGNGGWFVGGEFITAGNTFRTNLVHILNDSTVDPYFQPDPDGPVRALVFDGGKLYIGGEFSTVNGQFRNRLAAWNVATQGLAPWSPQANGNVLALLSSENVIYVGGTFTQIAGQSRRNIAALNTLSGSVLPWNPQGDGSVLAMALQDRKLYVGGFFNRIGGQLRNGLAALDLDSTNALPWNPNPTGGKVTSLQVVCNTVYVGGYFTNIGGATRFRVGALDSETGLATAWNPGLGPFHSAQLPSEVLAITVAGERVYVAGRFDTSAGQQDLAAFDATTGALLPWNPGLNGGVAAVGVAGRQVLVGMLNPSGGVERQNLAALDEATGAVLPLAAAVSGTVYALAYSADTLFVGGSFTNIGGLARSNLAALDADTGDVLPGWNAPANGNVYALAADGATLYAGGAFTTLGASNRLRLAAVALANGQVLPAWTAHADDTVYALDVLGPNLYAGGSFITVAGFAREHLAAVSLAAGSVQPWTANANQIVYALRADPATIYAGGKFTSINGQSRSHVAAMDPLTGLLTAWNPGADDEVRAITLSGTNLFLGGIFKQVGGAPRFGLAGVAAGPGSVLGWNPASSEKNRVYALGISDHSLYVGGSQPLEFDSAPGGHSLAAFPPEGFPVITQSPADIDVAPGTNFSFSVVAAGEPPLSYDWTRNGLSLSNNFPTYAGTAVTGGSALYEVTVSNRFGIAKAQATLTVLEPVAITTQPVSQSVANGATVTLSVSATGNPPPLCQWRLNGANIPGAVFPTLTVSNISPVLGGSYYAVVGNRLGAVNSSVAAVEILNAALPFRDNFAIRGSITTPSGSGTADNSGATFETGEPRHAGKTGGKSVWLSWVAPTNGIATFSTRGSAFDTLLAIYTGTAFNNLNLVAADEDRAGFLTSQVEFNAEAGVEYLIAVDGLGGASGPIVFNWTLDSASGEIPWITQDPISQSVLPGGQVTFSVSAISSTPASYQWFFGCREIRGATNASLTISNAGIHHVGRYRVFVMNQSARLAESLPAALELSSSPGTLSADKLEDLLDPGSPGTNGLRSLPKANLAGSGPLLVSLGTISFQTFDTTAATSSLRETNHCGIIGGVSSGIRFQPAQDGTVLIDTIGTPFDTVLAIYRNTNLLVLVTNPAAAFVTCDEDGAPDGIRSQLKFKAKASEIYLAVVDGVLGAEGVARIHWQLGSAPTIINTASNVPASFGQQVILSSGTASTTLQTSYQWFFNGVQIPGATNSTLTLTNLCPNQAGAYSVIASNFAGKILNHAATLQVNVPLHLDPVASLEGPQFKASVWANSNQTFILQASPDLLNWLPLLTNTLRTNPLPVSDPKAHQFPRRFYRVVPGP